MLMRYLFILYLVTQSSCVQSVAMEEVNLKSLIPSTIEEVQVRQAIGRIKAAVRNISIYLEDVDNGRDMSPKCLNIQCRFICFNGRQEEIAQDITRAMAPPQEYYCETIIGLHLYNYSFPNGVVPTGFLSIYANRIQLISISTSDVVEIQDGAFAGGIFENIVLENLHLKSLEKEFFAGISREFKAIAIIQQNLPLECVSPDYLNYVKFQIEKIQLSAGLTCVRNVTASHNTLGKVTQADFSYNDFSDQLQFDTFNKLTTIEFLVLTHSKISFLPSYIFNGMKFLKSLDLSHNQLTTISENIFGMSVPHGLTIKVGSNNWHCDCNLYMELNKIFVHPTTHMANHVYCSSPEEYKDWWVFDERLCYDMSSTSLPPTYSTTPLIPTTTTTTTSLRPTPTTDVTSGQNSAMPTIPTTIDPREAITLECHSADYLHKNRQRQNIWLPQIQFFPTAFGALAVKVTVEWSEVKHTFSLAWFSKTTKEYYMMELLPEEFGLGCYYTMPQQTIVTDLVPNVAYTFCLVDGHLATVSPFSCKSIHISGNLRANYNAWISTRMRAKGISLLVLGVVMFMFIGIAVVLFILKHKPIWLKGSKRIIKSKQGSGGIVVLPRNNTAKRMQHKENQILQINQQQFLPYNLKQDYQYNPESSKSYTDDNLYEVIPAYITFDKVPQTTAPSQPGFELLDSSYWPEDLVRQGSVRYTQIMPRSKRDSSDPLPALPSKVSYLPEQCIKT